MAILYGRFVSAIAALLLLSCSAASACNPGDFQCQNGYRYVCKCWTTTGCQYESDSGYCHHDDSDGPPAAASNFILLNNKYIRQAQLVCDRPRATVALEVCSGH
jgi:hypothetical protein